MARHIETGWLIENDKLGRERGRPQWMAVLGGAFAWTDDAAKAVRFSRAVDAMAVRSRFPAGEEMSVNEHQFIER